jgi:drug/metabolite transporter (DMT)-like permease
MVAQLRTSGLGIALVSAAAFGSSGSLASALIDSGWSPAAAVLVRLSVAALVLTVPAVVQLRGRWSLLRAHRGSIVVFGVLALAATQLCFFLAVEHVSVGVAILLEFSGIFLVVAWVWWRGQPPGPLTLVGAVVAIGGLVLVLDLLGHTQVSWFGVAAGLGAAVGVAAYFVVADAMGDELPPIAFAWAGMLVAVPTLLVAGLLGVVPLRFSSAPVELAGVRTSWVLAMAGLAVVATAFAYVTGIRATRTLGSRVASFVGLTEVLFAILIAWMMLGEAPVGIQAVGAVLVVTGVALVRADRPRAARDDDAAVHEERAALPVG